MNLTILDESRFFEETAGYPAFADPIVSLITTGRKLEEKHGILLSTHFRFRLYTHAYICRILKDCG